MKNNRQSPLSSTALRKPGHHLRKTIQKKTLYVLFFLFGPVCLYVGAILGAVGIVCIPYFYLVITGVFLIYFFIIRKWERKQRVECQKLELGLEGEVFVGEFLNSCKAENNWYILHDFQTNNGNIDHIIIAPQGVFTVETKAVSQLENESTIFYDCERVQTENRNIDSPLQQAKAEAAYLSEYIRQKLTMNLFVQPIVNYPGWKLQLCSGKKLDECAVWVCFTTGIPKVICSQPKKLSVEEQTRIYNFLASESQI